MAVEKVKGGFRWGKTGKVYKRRINAVKAGEKETAKKSSTGHSTGGVVKSGMSKGGKPGQWSARKAQMVAKQYKAKGGGYKS